jgi:hypothetical protein
MRNWRNAGKSESKTMQKKSFSSYADKKRDEWYKFDSFLFSINTVHTIKNNR